jgi:hypothetical protein
VKTREIPRPPKPTFTAEGGGWLGLQRPQPELAGKTPAELLALGAELPGNLRYVVRPGGKVVLVGEVRSLDAPVEVARQRLEQWLDGKAEGDAEAPPEETVEAALEGSGFAWSRREKGWAVPANETLPRELQLHVSPRGVRIEAVLVEWDDIAAPEAQALAQFLLAAQGGLRFARGELTGQSARLVAAADVAHLDDDLRHGLMGVAVGCRLLAREAAALLVPEAAHLFLEFHGAVAEKPQRAAE